MGAKPSYLASCGSEVSGMAVAVLLVEIEQ